MSELLSVQGLRKSYGDKVVLDDVSLTVQPHDVVCLIGSSGSGKSTLLRCLNLLEDVDDGVIRFDGREISDPLVDRREVRRRMGLVFQSYNLFPHRTALQNITEARSPYRRESQSVNLASGTVRATKNRATTTSGV